MGKARTVGIGMDYSATSKSALRWTVDNLIEEGDLIILIHVEQPKATRKQLFEDTGSPLIPLEEFNASKQYGLADDPEVLDMLNTVSRTKGAKVAAKVYWGDPREKLCDAVQDLKLNSLVVGSRGLRLLKRYIECLPLVRSIYTRNNINPKNEDGIIGTADFKGVAWQCE